MLAIDSTIIAVAGSAALHHMLTAAICRKPVILNKDGATLQAVGHVSELNLYPIKSMRALNLDSLYCGMSGMSTVDGKLFDR